MKTTLEYLQERRDMANHNLLCYSATYGMDRPREGCEEQFAEAQRDCEIVDELTALVTANETPPPWERQCVNKDQYAEGMTAKEKLLRLLQLNDDFAKAAISCDSSLSYQALGNHP